MKLSFAEENEKEAQLIRIYQITRWEDGLSIYCFF